MDNYAPTIGDKTTVSITPSSKGLVTATLKGCAIRRVTDTKGITIINENLQPECKLGVNIISAQSTATLAFSYKTFKWSMEPHTESQIVGCRVELDLNTNVTPIAAGNCPTDAN